MATIYQTNKKTGITYVIESESYWDKEKQQPRSHRTVIGKIDPETGEVVPTKKYQKRKADSEVPASPAAGDVPESQNNTQGTVQVSDKDRRIAALEKEVAQLHREKEDLLASLAQLIQSYNN